MRFDLPAHPKACLAVDSAVLSKIVSDPASHYVNVDTSQYPNGAVRGQLKAG